MWVAFNRKNIRYKINTTLCLITGKSRKKEKCQDATLYPLVEMESCPCDAFMSHPYGNWSACILPESKRDPQRGGLWAPGADKECGEGVRYRAIACSDKNGRPVDPSFCNSTGKEMDKEEQLRTCTALGRFSKVWKLSESHSVRMTIILICQ